MRKIIFLLLVTACFLIDVPAFSQNEETGSKQVVDNFQDSPAGKFPSVWRTWPFQRGKAVKVYKIAEENGQKYLHASDDQDLSQQIMRYFDWQPDRYPYLSWKWRAKKLPQGAREDDDNKNDSACGVYVIFGGYTGYAMKFAWSSTLPVGQIVTRREGKLKIKIAETGAAHLNTWQNVTINVADLHKELFGSAPNKNPNGIGILTDGNAMHTAAECDYKDFTISAKKPWNM